MAPWRTGQLLIPIISTILFTGIIKVHSQWPHGITDNNSCVSHLLLISFLKNKIEVAWQETFCRDDSCIIHAEYS